MSALLDHRGRPFPPAPSANGHANGNGKKAIPPEDRPELRPTTYLSRRRTIHASYDAARPSVEFDNYWANADRLDADSANSKSVRDTLVSRSRYETGSNGYYDGLLQTVANFVVGKGPALRMQEPDKAFNRAVELAWWRWCKAVLYRRKLWCLCHAKVQDGGGFAVMRINPNLNHPVKLDLVLFETEQCTSPRLPFVAEGRIDGIHFDQFGNPTFYDVLRYHPGGQWSPVRFEDAEKIPTAWVVHWYTLRRPGQQRGVPEFRSTLNVGASHRRWREATVTAAESAADFAVLLHTTLPPENGPDPVAPFSSTPIDKRSQAALPMGWDATQMEAHHPNSTYEAFHRSQINEQARPKSIPQNIAMCDSSGYNFASGKLDQETFFLGVDIEREDGDDLANEKVFARWWELAVLTYGWNADPREPGAHRWDWPKHPVGDIGAVASANDTRLKNGTLSPSEEASNGGLDFEDRLEIMAKDYGKSVEDMRTILLRNNLAQGAADGTDPAADDGGLPAADDGDAAGDPAMATAKGAASAGDVQGTALNGAQIASLLLICDKLAARSYPPEAVTALVKASFPLMDPALIEAFVTSLRNAPATPRPAPSPTPPPGDPNADQP